MNKRTRSRKERYTIIIASQTDARKKSTILSITRRTLTIILCGVIITVLMSAGVAVFSSGKVLGYSDQIAQLENKANEQLALTDSYTGEAGYMFSESGEPAFDRIVSGTDDVSDTGEPYTYDNEPAPTDIDSPNSLKTEELYTLSSRDYSAYEEASVSMPMSEAIKMVESEFQAEINEEIAYSTVNQEYDEMQIVYDAYMDGDSETVNNWADVTSIFAAETMCTDQELLTISMDKIELLSSIYNEMNEVTIYSTKAPHEANGKSTADETGSIDVLTVHILINNLTYSDGAELHDFDRAQLRRIKELMSRDYYLFFSDLLGIDIYNGMEYEGVRDILANLPEGKTGSTIVKEALVRLGDPYSKARRGSGSYVDCSYFTWWVYSQVDISIPTSSVEQARYCYNNGYKVEESDLKPGDLIFWSKKRCHCGRWHEIHHAGIYLGDNKIIDASSSKGRVVIREIWGRNGATWKIFMYARPYDEA